MTNLCGLLHLRADHHARRVAQRHHWNIEGVAKLDEARRLVGAVGIDRAAEMMRVVGDQPERPTLNAQERRDHAHTEARAQFEHRSGVGQRIDDAADVISAQPVFRHRLPQQALIGAGPLVDPALEIGEILLRGGDAFGFVIDQNIDDAIGRLHRHRADVLGPEHAEAAAFDHRRAAHADVRGLIGDDDVATAE